jgi:2-keto-4-pentenoate hydratase/2-oxohepta-3-ene-1,7-dioic acid hydratase in catechol pathway
VQLVRFVGPLSGTTPRSGVIQGTDIMELHGDPSAPIAGERIASLDEVTLVAPCDPRIIVCAGSNYASSLADLGRPTPEQPPFFLKAANTIVGPGAAIRYPRGLERLEYEGELAVVIGKTASNVSADDYADFVLGYTCANDVTASDWRADGQWLRAKSIDTFCPIGPWIETGIDDPSDLHLRTLLNGVAVQDCDTSDMIFPVPELLAWITQWITLQPSDIVLTSTPAGVGQMHPGDLISVEISGIGTLDNVVRAQG